MHYDRVTVVDHPMVQHKLSKLRNKNTSSKDFRALVRELAMFEGYEATRDLALEDVEVETPICKAACKQVAGKKMVIVPILRAGLGMVEGLQELMPSTFVGHLGMYRDPETHEPHEYYAKLPDSISQRDVLVVDPMLATGGSMELGYKAFLTKGTPKRIHVCSVIATPEGIEHIKNAFPEDKTTIWCAAIDPGMNEHKYIVPGFGDAGDLCYGGKL